MESRMLTLQLLLLFSVFSLFSILLCCWVLFAPRVTVPPVSDFKFGVGATYRVLSWRLPNPPASTAQWATHFHWCCNSLLTKKGYPSRLRPIPLRTYSPGTLHTSWCLPWRQPWGKTCLLWNWEYTAYSDAEEKTGAATHGPHRDMACSEHRMRENP